jgi:hypothetical protein
MWWLLPLIGFFVGTSFVYLWTSRGILAALISGIVVGEAISVYAAFIVVPQMQPRPLETYLQYPGFVMGAGLFWAVLWCVGVVLGTPVGLLLRERKYSN